MNDFEIPFTQQEYKVLIVDDIPKNIQVLGSILGEKDIKVGFATSGRQALKILETQLVDLILLDIAMPEMDGFEVCRILKENPKTKHIPVIFLTARVQIDDVLRGFELGAVDYVTKPFNPAVLLSRVFTHLELKRSRDTMAKYIDVIDKQNSELVDLNYTKDKLFSIISHDLRNPIGNIKGMLEMLLQSSNLDADTNSLLTLGNKAAVAAYNLIENLLSWSRSQMGRISIYPSETDIDVLIRQNIDLQAVNTKTKNINILWNNLEQINSFCDEQMINTVLRNLISNAVKFTHKNGTIEVKVKEIAVQQGIDLQRMYQISIKDTGVGMTKELLDKVFVDKEIRTEYGTDNEKGSGLGLKICKEFVERNGGTLWIESVKDEGSTFFFTVPVAE